MRSRLIYMNKYKKSSRYGETFNHAYLYFNHSVDINVKHWIFSEINESQIPQCKIIMQIVWGNEIKTTTPTINLICIIRILIYVLCAYSPNVLIINLCNLTEIMIKKYTPAKKNLDTTLPNWPPLLSSITSQPTPSMIEHPASVNSIPRSACARCMLLLC